MTKRAIYHIDEESYDIVETTSEWLLIEYVDDYDNSKLKLEIYKPRDRKGEYDDGYGSE